MLMRCTRLLKFNSSPLRKLPFEKETIVFQPSILQVLLLLVSGGVTIIVPY